MMARLTTPELPSDLDCSTSTARLLDFDHRLRRLGALARLVALGVLLSGAVSCTHKHVLSVPIEARIESPNSRHIRVDGIATVQVSPDVVDLEVTLTSKQERPKAAVVEVGAKRDALVSALRSAGIAGNQLRLGHVDVSPSYRPHPNHHIVDGYEATITLVITLSQFERIGELMDRAASGGASRILTRFRSTKLAQVKLQARELALAAARAKAEQMARIMNVAVGEVISIEEIARDMPTFGSESNVMALRSPSAPSEVVQPGALPLTLTVQVTYALGSRYGGYPAFNPSAP